MEKTFAWNLTNFSSHYESISAINPIDGSRSTVTTLCRPGPSSEIFTTDYGSFTAQWMIALVPDEHRRRRMLEGIEGIKECWTFHLDLVGVQVNSDNSEPQMKRRFGFATNVELAAKCQIFLVNPKQDGRAPDEPFRWVNPPKYLQCGSDFATVNLGWPRYARFTDDNSSDDEDEILDEHEVCLVAKKIHKHREKWVDAADDTLHVRVCVKLLDIRRTSGDLNENLISDMGEILDSGSASDVVIKCGLDSFPAHKLILSLRSPVFRRMLQADMTEAASGEIKIDDCEPFVLKQFLEFLYTAKVNLLRMSHEQVIGLIAAGDKYDVLDLKHYCFQHLFSPNELKKDTSGKLAVAAYLHGAEPHHKSLIYEYNAERWKELGAQEEFQTLVKAYPAAFLKPETINL